MSVAAIFEAELPQSDFPTGPWVAKIDSVNMRTRTIKEELRRSLGFKITLIEHVAGTEVEDYVLAMNNPRYYDVDVRYPVRDYRTVLTTLESIGIDIPDAVVVAVAAAIKSGDLGVADVAINDFLSGVKLAALPNIRAEVKENPRANKPEYKYEVKSIAPSL